jgi:nicotinamide-nucleotide amidase
MKAEIINIGDELLIGQVVNTNASFMAEALNKSGIMVNRITSISDNENEITAALDEAFSRVDIVISTGGLGPTKDDITKQVICSYFDDELVMNQQVYDHVAGFFKNRNLVFSKVNQMQALVPSRAKVLFNENGTAPGMWIEKNNKVYIASPGVPFEMKALLTDKIIPELRKRFNISNQISHRTIMTTGMGESMLAERIDEWAESLPDNIKLAYLPKPGMVRLRLSQYTNGSGSDKHIDEYVYKLEKLIPELIFGYDDIQMEEVIGELLKKNNYTISTAESCTGGYISHLITSIAGSSAYYKGSVVSYSNEIKKRVLQVSQDDLNNFGAVSKQVVEQMALGVQKLKNTDFALATSGIAGPDGGTDEKPVGTVWIALASPEGVHSELFHFGEHRGRNITRSSQAALNMLRLGVLAHKD